MSSFNKVIIMGNLTRTPELRSTGGGTQVCDITVACNDSYQDKNGTTQERAVFVECTCWGKTAENVCRWKKQGDPILVEGRLMMDEWQDKETGKKRTKLKVTAVSVTFLGRGEKEGGDNGRQDQKPVRSGGGQRRAAPKPVADDNTEYATDFGDNGNPPF